MRRLLAVLGKDVSASLSPTLHQAAASALSLDIAYVPVSCADAVKFREAVQALRTLGALGCNVTIPYKLDALRLADDASDVARDIQGANTLVFEAGRVVADNTDGPALESILSRLDPDLLQRVQVLGAGGASRAALWALERVGARAVFVCARRHHTSSGAAEPAWLVRRPLEKVSAATLVISALPGTPELARSAVDWIDFENAPMILDLAYGGPLSTSPLVGLAHTEGCVAHDGRTMLVEQAALSLARWTGAPYAPILAAMRDALTTPKGAPSLL